MSFVTKRGRRASVCAEVYDPAADSDSDSLHQIYPKTDRQRRELVAAVEGILLFSSLDRQQMSDVIDAMFERKVTSGDIIMQQGDDGDYFYVISSGIYDIFVDGSCTCTLRENGSFGELALMYNMPRSATVRASTDGSLWAMDRESFRRIVLQSAFKKRTMYDDFIASVPLLQRLNGYQRMKVADALHSKSYKDGDVILKQGEAADGMYFVIKGRVRITKVQHGKENVVAYNEPGTYFGEYALLKKSPRQASAFAIGHVKLAFLSCERFERLLGPCMEELQRHSNVYVNSIV